MYCGFVCPGWSSLYNFFVILDKSPLSFLLGGLGECVYIFICIWQNTLYSQEPSLCELWINPVFQRGKQRGAETLVPLGAINVVNLDNPRAPVISETGY